MTKKNNHQTSRIEEDELFVSNQTCTSFEVAENARLFL
jgi:hypothetical protein